MTQLDLMVYSEALRSLEEAHDGGPVGPWDVVTARAWLLRPN
jgi:hypothetical protein